MFNFKTKGYENFKHFSVVFFLSLPMQAPLCARITVNGIRAELSPKRKFSISDWDFNKSRLEGLSDETKIVNNCIKQVNSQLLKLTKN